MSSAPPSEVVRLEVPASTEHLRLVRLVVAGLASSHGADLDDLEDLRIATGEVCAHLVGVAGGDDRLVVEVSAAPAGDDGATSVTIDAVVPGAVGAPFDDLAAMLLDTTTDRRGTGPRPDDVDAAVDLTGSEGSRGAVAAPVRAIPGARAWCDRRLGEGSTASDGRGEDA